MFIEMLLPIFFFNFQQDKGLPALLVYKDGDLIGNNLNVTDSVGTDFTETDIEEFLLQYIIYMYHEVWIISVQQYCNLLQECFCGRSFSIKA